MTKVTNSDDRDSRLAALLDELTEAARIGKPPQVFKGGRAPIGLEMSNGRGLEARLLSKFRLA